MAKNKRFTIVLLLGGALLLACLVFSISCGAGSYGFFEMLSSVLKKNQNAASSILLYVRLPRTLAALFAGMGLATSGSIIQNVLNNPMAGPSIIGVNSGAGFMAVLFMALFPGNVSALPLAAFLGALLAMLIITFAARKTGASRSTLILSGVAVNALLGAASDAVTTFFPDALLGASSFKIGSFAAVSAKTLYPAIGLILISLIAAMFLRNELDILALGDDTAKSLGLNVSFTRFFLLLIAAALAGASVSFAGLLGFVGLIVPHAIRLFARTGDSRLLLPASALYGGAFVLFSDSLCRLIFSPYEFPVGIAMAFLGVPLFLFLLFRRKGGRVHD